MSRNKRIVIAIDGPAGAGKSTVAALVAKKLGFLYVDTGAMYRALTLKALKNKISLTNKNLLIEMAQKTDIKLDPETSRVFLDNKDVSTEIRNEQVSKTSHFIASIPEIREILWQIQRGYRDKYNIVMEGRDIGSVVFPDAQIKIYLDASVDERAKRRYKQLKQQNLEYDITEIKKEIILRDEKDRNRSIAPLIKAKDAAVIDTTSMNIPQVVNAIIKIYQQKYSEKKEPYL
ncbi:MAG TPA: (d)CMP kinase [bacterium]|nr:(d)CMP kinase [bacterium]